MRTETNFLTPRPYLCFFFGLIGGASFYAVLFFLHRSLDWPLERLLGVENSNQIAVVVYVSMYILFFWGMAIIWYKNQLGRYERSALSALEHRFQGRILSKRSEIDAIRNMISHGHELSKVRDTALAKTLLFLMDHCLVTETSERVVEIFSKRMDTLQKNVESSYNILQYVAWAIPSLGFIGTVMGIGAALGQAGLATEDIKIVTVPLGMAFDTTLIALVESVILVFFIYSMQNKEESLLNTIDLFCQEKFIINLRLEQKN